MSSNQEYQDLKLHELQLSRAQQTSYCYARALVSPAGDQGWREGEGAVEGRVERATGGTERRENEAHCSWIYHHSHTLSLLLADMSVSAQEESRRLQLHEEIRRQTKEA